MVLEKDQIVHKEAVTKKEPKVSKKTFKMLGIGVGAVVVIAVIAILALNTMEGMKAKNVDAAFQGYVTLIGNGKYDEAYNQYLSASFKKDMDLKAFTDMAEFYLTKLGPSFEKKIEDRQFIEQGGKTVVDIFCTSLYPSGPALEKYLMVKEGDGWKIEGFDVQSPALAAAPQDADRKQLPEDLPEEVAKELTERKPF